MNKSPSKQTKSKFSPDKLSKIGGKAGIELTETELGQAAGGASLKLKLKFW
jgi:hypothetical protein